MRTFKIYSFSNVQVPNTVLLIIVTKLYLRLNFSQWFIKELRVFNFYFCNVNLKNVFTCFLLRNNNFDPQIKEFWEWPKEKYYYFSVAGQGMTALMASGVMISRGPSWCWPSRSCNMSSVFSKLKCCEQRALWPWAEVGNISDDVHRDCVSQNMKQGTTMSQESAHIGLSFLILYSFNIL